VNRTFEVFIGQGRQTRFVRIFAGFRPTAEVATNWSRAAKIGNFSLNASSFLKYLEMCGRL